jgi:hypothetical protein
MGKIEQGIEFTGSIGNFTAYKMRGVDGIVVRKKGGVSRKRIKKDSQYEQTRLLNAEFAGRSAASKRIMNVIHPLKALADYNIAGPINAMLRPLQVDDPKNSKGERAIELSKDPGLLEGFSLNRKIVFESIVRAPLTTTLSRETMSGEVSIPAIRPDINFKPQTKHPLYSFEVALGVVPDLFFSKHGYKPSHKKYLPENLSFSYAASEWFPCTNGSPATNLALNVDFTPPDNHFILVLSIGIRFGYPTRGNDVEQARYAGAAKILRVV